MMTLRGGSSRLWARRAAVRAALRTAGVLTPPGLLLFIGACGGGGNGGQQTGLRVSVNLGEALAGLTASNQAAFTAGQTKFVTAEGADEGLGPVFNGLSCSECHRQGAVGGAGDNLAIARVSRIGVGADGSYSDLTEVGGPTIQSRSLQEFDGTYPVPPEIVPPEAKHISHRITTPLFGAGLIEAVDENEIRKNIRSGDPDGIRGKPNVIVNPETNRQEIGRFGWKAQISTLTFFAGDAYLNEMGVTSPRFAAELLPQGKPIPSGADAVADPEDDGGDIVHFANFMRLLAPPSRAAETAQTRRGEAVFERIRCAQCHTPKLKTGINSVAALSQRDVPLFSDLLLHNLGTGLADGIQQGSAKGDEFRTAPLWGLRYRKFLLHDGRAETIEDAIFAHSGEAEKAMERFSGLQTDDRNDLISFLKSL